MHAKYLRIVSYRIIHYLDLSSYRKRVVGELMIVLWKFNFGVQMVIIIIIIIFFNDKLSNAAHNSNENQVQI